MPNSPSLTALLEAARSPGVLKEEVDALVRGLALPLAEGETPRARADFLLSLIASPDMYDLEDSEGRSVRSAAVQALLDLGYPYALELPPEALDASLPSRWDLTGREVPKAGLIAAGIALALQSIEGLPGILMLLFSGEEVNAGFGLFALAKLLGPTLAAVLGGWGRIRWLQRLGVVTMALTAVLRLMSVMGWFGNFNPWGPGLVQMLIWLTEGGGLLLGALLLRHPEWLPQDKKADVVETPQDPR